MTRFFRPALLLAGLSLAGCIMFDKKSEAVAFHDLGAPSASASKKGPTVFIPRVLIPSALRRPNVVMLDGEGRVRLEDMHRWVGPLDRLLAEGLGRHVVADTGLPVSLSATDQPHLVLLVTVDRLALETPERALLALHYRIEKSDGELLTEASGAWRTDLTAPYPPEFVKAQSNNLAKAAADISTQLSRFAAGAHTSPQ